MGYFKLLINLLLVWSVVNLIGLSCGALMEFGVDSISGHKKLLQVQRKLKLLNKHAVKSILSEDGDIIDCVDIYKQPAFDHPSLRDHTIQMKPSLNLTNERTTSKTTKGKERESSSMSVVTSQLWQRRGRCPKGTIPVRRIRKESLLSANSVSQYGRKKPRFPQQHYSFKHPRLNGNSYLLQENHSLAMLVTVGSSYSGAKGDIKVWNPFVESDEEYSTSQVALRNGPYFDYEGIQSGWAVNPSVYGDKKTRLFVYWTADSSKTTGCFDLTCPGFVQTSSEVALGAAIFPISLPQRLPYQITLYIFKDPYTSNWWVQYGERINIGYWPPDLFGLLRHHAESVEWGGEVYSSKTSSGSRPHQRRLRLRHEDAGSRQLPGVEVSGLGRNLRRRVRLLRCVLRWGLR